MRSFFESFLGFFLSPAGLTVLAALDSSLVFFMPLGMDFVLILMSAREPGLFWLYAVLASTGSMAGSALTFWVGRQLGEKGLTRFISPSRLNRVKERISHGASVSVAALALIPPPFPFTAFILGGGAFGVEAKTFFLALLAAKLLRFGITGALAAYFGSGIVNWMESTTFELIVAAMITIALGGTLFSIVTVIQKTRKGR